jgi:hypothetical protein
MQRRVRQYTRLELRKEELQDAVKRHLGVWVEDPEVLVSLGQDCGVLPQGRYEVFEEFEEFEAPELVIIIELFPL